MSTAAYNETDFEEFIEGELLNSDYVSLPHSTYNRRLCLVESELIQFLQSTQEDAYQKLEAQYGVQTDQRICERISKSIQQLGVLDVLRKGVKDRGVHLRLVFFKPSSRRNPEHEVWYAQNRFGVMRQLHFSEKNEKSLDLGLFINGIPIITAELKNSLTGQTVENAKKQYRTDRDPREPLLKFKRCLVHFAVGNEQVFMTTQLRGLKTFFLPFNLDIENPVNPNGHKTAYLWEHFWQKEVLLNLIQNYLLVQVNEEKVYNAKKQAFETEKKEVLIFPRFHQYDVVTRLLADARQQGPGERYLVQHSAGSGKSNSIAWLSHGLRQLFDEEGNRIFDSIIVITDRKVLDKQLQDTITQFEQVSGTVVPITKTSEQLKESLEQGKDIIISTLQKFPVISESITALEGKTFAVVIDEAHSSQTGETSKHLKKTLSANLDEAELEDLTGDDLEDEVIKEIKTRGKQKHISFFAFTATPKNKTLELFGTKNSDGHFEPFHTYEMRQAIEEGFIHDVLRNYTTFSRYFKLLKTVDDDHEYETSKAVRALTSYVDLQPHAIEQKTRIMLGHFLTTTVNAIQGKARAMLVTRSRLHAVKYFLMFQKVLLEKGMKIRPIVAFSGTVKDPDTGLEHTENSLNNFGMRINTQDAFKLPEYRILIVANKFQTGFDCPPLHTMYVDKKLSGVQAVQTLSRLNRTMGGKTIDDTVVLDFVNEALDIQAAFQPYYQRTALVEETDPNKLYDIETELDQLDVFTQADVDDYAHIFYDETKPNEQLQPVLDRVVDQWRTHSLEQREEFRSKLQSFIRLYSYISQLIDFVDSGLEKLYIFSRALNRKLPKREGQGLPPEIFEEVDLDSFRIQKRYEGSIQLATEDGTLAPISAETGSSKEPVTDYLSEIVKNLNETFGVDLNDKDKVRFEEFINEIRDDEALAEVMKGNNTYTNKLNYFDEKFEDKLVKQVQYGVDFYDKISEQQVKEIVKRKLFAEILKAVG